MTPPKPADQVKGLRDAASLMTGCAEIEMPLCAAEDNRWLGELSPALAKPIASSLRAAAELIERAGSPLGLPVNNALEIAGLVLGRDLGHNR